jgi:hypothetical protein
MFGGRVGAIGANSEQVESLTLSAGCIFVHTGRIFSAILAFLSVGAEWAGTENFSFCAANVREQLGPFFIAWGCPSQKLIEINRENR